MKMSMRNISWAFVLAAVTMLLCTTDYLSAAAPGRQPKSGTVMGVIKVRRVFPDVGNPTRIKSDGFGNFYILYVYTTNGHKLAEYKVHGTSGQVYGAIDFTLVGEQGYLINPAGSFLFDLPQIR